MTKQQWRRHAEAGIASGGDDVLGRKSPICRYDVSIPHRRRNAAAYAFAVDASTSKLVTNQTCSSSLERCGTAKTVTSTDAVGGRFRCIVYSSTTVSAVDTLNDEIPVAPISDTVANREAVVSDHLDPGEAQAFVLADAYDGRLLTDDGDARSFAKDQGITVVGSVGVLLAAIDAGKIDKPTADEWLSAWIDEISYCVPYRSISEYR